MRVVVESEPEWLDDDVEAAIEWQAYRNSLCSGCGHPRDESFAYENSDGYTAEPATCQACKAQQEVAWLDNKDRKSGDKPVMGRYYVTTLDER